VISEPLAHTLARIGGGLFGATCILYLLVSWLTHIRGADRYSPQVKKWKNFRGVALFLGLGILGIVYALSPMPLPTTERQIAREYLVAVCLPGYVLFFLAYVVWVIIAVRKTLG
jgi:hypothetical protein